ncbi:MAG TPA: hypothetical protein VEM57_10095 [Candidatus Binatus sp.]|nr:hypothetical protein [Candidatus Binatus sp.]
MYLRLGLAGLACLAGCVRVPPPPAPGTGTLWGYVRLVPRAGVTPGKREYGPYADRRLRDVTFVDYSRPSFAVVYLDGPASPGGSERVTITRALLRPSLAPQYGAVGAGGTVVVTNADWLPHTVSCPAAHLLRRLAPDEEVEIVADAAGPLPLFLVDAPGIEGVVFVAPGPYAVVSREGRWELRDLTPGPQEIRAWHPRLPGASHAIEVSPGVSRQVDVAIGVGNLDGHAQTP